MMKRLLLIATAALALSGCTLFRQHHRSANPYDQPPFYAKYLNQQTPIDQRIYATLAALQTNPHSAALHNDLGQLLASRGFPKDAEKEFERAISDDRGFYAAWYNLGLLRASRNDFTGARIAFSRAVHYKPGYSEALFQMGLIEEERGNEGTAVDYYAKALLINRRLLDVKWNPRIIDSKLIDLALLKAYPQQHVRDSASFQPTPAGYGARSSAAAQPAVSPQAPAENIVTPAAPVTDPGKQTPPPNAPVFPPPPATST